MKVVTILLALFVTPALFAAAYPLPGSDKQTVICTGCNGINFSGQKNAGLPTWPYSSPISKHLGRLVDSSSTKDVQNIGIRTVRAGKIRLGAGTSPTRVYVKMGGAIGVYNLSTFFTSKLPAGMKDVSNIARVGGSRTAYNSPNELLTVWDAYVYAEDYGGSWPVTPDDKQDVLHDFDIDDRGYVYAAYATFGWGILKDSGESGSQLLGVISNRAESAGAITVAKGGSSYYMAVAANDSAATHAMYDVTNPAAPAPMGTRNFGLRAWAKHDATGRIAIIDDKRQLRVYDGTSFGTGGAPLFGPASAGVGSEYSDVTFDEAGNLWVVDESTAYLGKLYRFTTNYSRTAYDLGESFSAKSILPNTQMITAAGGFVAVAGAGLRGTDVMLFKVEGNSVRKLNLNNFFNKYYHNAPPGYANPPTDQSYVVSPYGLKLIKQNNKLYLMYNSHGMGDVYEIEAGDSIGATMRTNSFGTANPHSKGTPGDGPFVGDVVKFVANSSNAGVAYQVSWDFGNSESGSNSATSTTGVDVSHQFAGYTTANAISSVKKVTVSAVNDPSLTDTVNVTLKVPTARIGLANSNTILTPAGGPYTVLLGDSFTDASDGSVESHFANWQIDGLTPTPKLPGDLMPVGTMGSHTVTMAAYYGRYNAALVPQTAMYTPTVSNVSYVVRPFLASISSARSGANAVFTGTGRVTTNTQVLTATQWNYTWTLLSGATVVQTATGTALIGQIPDFVVPMTSIPTAGGSVTLKVEVAPSTLVGDPQFTAYTHQVGLERPAPTITRTGCANVNAPCTLTAGGTNISDATLSWSVTNGTVTLTGTGATFSPTFTQTGNYTATVTASRGIFEGSATIGPFTVAGAICGPPPTADQMTVTHSCPGGTCEANETVTFRTSVIGYQRQDCDDYTWVWGDNTTNGNGEGTSASPSTHIYKNNGTYTVRLTVTNSSAGAVPLQLIDTVLVGGGGNNDPPPQTCVRASNLVIVYSGSGCNGNSCRAGSRVTFTVYKNGADRLTPGCDTATWSFGDNGIGSGGNSSHTYSTPGTYPVTVSVLTAGFSNPATATINITIGEGNNGGNCTTAPTADNLIPQYRGAACSALNPNALCQRGETIQFDIDTFGGYAFQSCDRFEWNFGDGSAVATTKNPTHVFTGPAPSYRVTARVYNTANPTGVTLTMDVPFDSAPIEPQPTITVSGPTKVGKGVAVTFTATATLNATGWSWNFGDGSAVNNSQAGVVGTSTSISHVYTKSGTFNVTVSAKNANDATDRSRNSGVLTSVAVTDVPVYRFLLPAVIHDNGQNGSLWRTDVQVYYGAPSPSAEPLLMTAEFNGRSTQLSINQATFIYEDFVNRLISGNGSGSVLITTQTKYKPQIWTRTYNVDPSGKTYGQFIPAIDLDSTTSGSVVGQADPTRYYLSGLRQDARYRTNLGFVNTGTSDIIADVTAYDDLMMPLDRFAVTLPPFTLVPKSLGTIKGVGSRPVSLEISVPAGKRLVAYASVIDGFSNDPAFQSAIGDTELASADYGTSITPGVGHIGAWRSDVTVFNPDDRNPVTFDLEYYDGSGFRRGLATNITLGPLQARNYEDLLRVSNLFSPVPPDGVGMLKLTTRTSQARYPMTFSRTYNDKGTGGTFGQGIPSFAASRANVKNGKPAIIAGVRSNANYKTNIGLTNATASAVNVKVSLLDPNTGLVASEQGYTLVGYASIVGEYPFGGLATGALKVEITGGEGAVWAFASVIDRNSEDPEYVPASPVQ